MSPCPLLVLLGSQVIPLSPPNAAESSNNSLQSWFLTGLFAQQGEMNSEFEQLEFGGGRVVREGRKYP